MKRALDSESEIVTRPEPRGKVDSEAPFNRGRDSSTAMVCHNKPVGPIHGIDWMVRVAYVNGLPAGALRLVHVKLDGVELSELV